MRDAKQNASATVGKGSFRFQRILPVYYVYTQQQWFRDGIATNIKIRRIYMEKLMLHASFLYAKLPELFVVDA